MTLSRLRRSLALVAFTCVALALASCFNPFDPRLSSERAASVPAPIPNSPQNVVRLFAWCWVNRDAARYQEVFTDDYRFQFAPNDSAGNPYRQSPWLREDEMISAQHLFVGGLDRPPASNITVSMDNTLLANPDGRPGKTYHWHRSIHVGVDTKVTITDASGSPAVTPITGKALFYLVRGDSAAIPPELVKQGFKPDSSRWWIERWEDETAGATGGSARPAPLPFGARPASTILPAQRSFGWLKVLFR